MANHDVFSATARMLADATDNVGQGEMAGNDADSKWLGITRTTYRNSTDWVEENQRAKWEHSIHLFRSEHPPGSKYHTEAYKYRSKLFRPKPRANLRRHEAACAAAYFSTGNLVSVSPGNQNDPKQRVTADIVGQLINVRLKARNTHWFLNVMGAYQTAMVQGAVVSKQTWRYEEVETTRVVMAPDPVTGAMVETEVPEVKRLHDRPDITLVPLENFRFDPGADWTQPIQSSPYLIHLQPMYAGDVLERMDRQDPKTGQPAWRKHDLATVLRHGTVQTEADTVRRARRGKGTNPYEVIEGSEFSTVWVREYIVRHQGQDLLWYTLGDSLLLSDPVPLEDVYLHGRPFVLGYALIEAFNPLPDSLIYTARHLSAKANDIDNQRTDNVRLVLNKRYFIRRGAKIDTKQLFKSVPGGAVTMNDPNTDIRWDDTRDVTASAYNEQDRVNMDFDELTGSMMQSTIASARSLNETVGGMELLNNAADAVTEYQLRVFNETWVEPVLQQIGLLEQQYETDEVILAMAASRSKQMQRYGLDRVYDWMLDNEILVQADVGMGATNSKQKLDKMVAGINAIAGLPTAMARIQEDEVIAEVFGALGYQDGARFFKPMDQFQQEQAQRGPPPDPRIAVEQMRQQGKQAELQQQGQIAQMVEQNRKEIAFAKLAAGQQTTMQSLFASLGADKEARLDDAKVEMTKVVLAEQGRRMAETNRQRELAFKQQTGMSGI